MVICNGYEVEIIARRETSEDFSFEIENCLGTGKIKYGLGVKKDGKEINKWFDSMSDIRTWTKEQEMKKCI